MHDEQRAARASCDHRVGKEGAAGGKKEGPGVYNGEGRGLRERGAWCVDGQEGGRGERKCVRMRVRG